jgi:hypothetical protein
MDGVRLCHLDNLPQSDKPPDPQPIVLTIGTSPTYAEETRQNDKGRGF